MLKRWEDVEEVEEKGWEDVEEVKEKGMGENLNVGDGLKSRWRMKSRWELNEKTENWVELAEVMGNRQKRIE